MDDNTTKVLLIAIPSAAFVVIVALVVFGLTPGECIEIEAPGGGKITKCRPLPNITSMMSVEQINLLENQIEEINTLQNNHQQQRIIAIKEREPNTTPLNFTMSSISKEKQYSLLQQIRLLSSEESSRLSKKLSSDKTKIDELEKIAEFMMQERDFSWQGEWKVKGTIGVFDLFYDGKFILNYDGTYESSGTLDGKPVIGSGTYVISRELGTFTSHTSDSEQTQYFFVNIEKDSFEIWSPLEIQKLEFSKIN